MITFVPAWHGVSSGDVSTDDLIGPMRALQSSGEAFRIIVTEYLPNLRYFLHRFGLLESDTVSIFDRLQGSERMLQSPLALGDLNFPEEVHYTYTPFSVLVYLGEDLIGEVSMGEGGHISEVKHFEKELLTSIEVYDDRGFLSSRKIIEGGAHVCTEYLDVSGRCIFVHFQEDGSCAVNYDNAKGLLRKYYESLENLVYECLEGEFRHFSAQNILISIHNGNKAQVARSNFLDSMVLSYFNRRVSLNKEERYLDHFLLSQARAIIVDAQGLLQDLILITGQAEKIHKISPFDSRFILSLSQEMKKEVVYLDMRHTALEENKEIVDHLFLFIRERMEEEERSFKIIIRTSHFQEEDLKLFYEQLVRAQYPEEMTFMEDLTLEGEGENSVELSFLKMLKVRVAFVKRLLKSLKVLVFENDEKLFQTLYETRLIIDFARVPDLFTQIAGISSGVPQLNGLESEYVQEGRNGLVVSSTDQLPKALSYYLDELKHWQEARVFSVQQIKRFSGLALSQKIVGFFKGE